MNFVFKNRDELPIEQKEAVEELFNSIKPNYCINCAAYTAVDKAETEREQAKLINGYAPGLLAQACEANNTRLIHISTDYVFNGRGNQPYKEDDPVDPVNWYGATKLEGERQIQAISDQHIILRTSWLYSRHGHNFVKTMIRLQDERPEIRVVNDQQGSPTSARDLAYTIIQIIEQCESESPKNGGIYHYSNTGIITWFDFASAIKEIRGSDCKIIPVSSGEFPTPASRPAYSGMDTSKIKAEFNLAIPGWRQSLERMLLTINQ